MLFFLLSLVALMTLLSVFKREVTFIKARSEGAGSGAAPGDKHRQLDKQAVEEALRRLGAGETVAVTVDVRFDPEARDGRGCVTAKVARVDRERTPRGG